MDRRVMQWRSQYRERKSRVMGLCIVLVATCIMGACIYNIIIGSNDAKDVRTDIVVIDGEKLKSQAKCFKMQEKLALELSEVLSKLRELEDETKGEFVKVKNNKKMDDTQKSRENIKIEEKWKEQSSKYMDKISKIKEIDVKVTTKIQSILDKVIEKISRDLKIKLVVNKSAQDGTAVIYNDPVIDITSKVIKMLDKELPNVDLKEF